MSKKNIYFLIIYLLFVNFTTKSYAYDDKITHPDITEKAIESSQLDQYLKNNLGFENGIERRFFFNNELMTIKKRLQTGSTEEDDGCRKINHFHDPLLPWDQSYVTDEPWEITSWCFVRGYSPKYSNITWATGYEEKGGALINRNKQDMGWDHARDYYHKALTLASKDDRETNFAKTFYSLGHVMHLLQDVSVPAHVRNDFMSHISQIDIKGFYQPYERYVKKNQTIIDEDNPIPPNFNNATTIVTDFWDTDQYNGSNIPGIAEFANYNYFSDSTIRSNNPPPVHLYPNPAISSGSYEVCEDYAPGSTQYKLWYISRKAVGGCDHFAVVSINNLLMYFPDATTLNNNITSLKLYLDDNVHRTYAKELIPRAVGYSVGLLDYFFRGEFHVALLVPSVDQASLDFGNQNDTGSDIDTVAVFIQNNSKIDGVIEPIGEGTLTLTVSYKDTSNNDTIVYESVTNPVSVTSIPEKDSGSYFTYLFTLTNPVPTQIAEDITYYLAFKGQLGNETDAVIGRAINAPVLKQVSPNEGLGNVEVTITGNNLPTIDGPFPTTSEDVRFHHDLTKPYSANVENRTDTIISVDVPDTAGLKKPGYGGLRVRNVSAAGEKIYSNPVPFYPIAQGEVKNTGTTSTIDVTITANGPIVGDYDQLPSTINISGLAPDASSTIQLKTGFTYKATANTTVTKDIELLTPDPIDFVFEVE